MFLEQFGLREDPFGMTPDPAYLYASRTHAEALASLSEGVRDTRGFLALVAEPGMGKTTLLYQLAQELRETTRIVHVSQTQCNSREFIEYILQELGLDVNGISFVAMQGKLNEILFEELLAGKRFLLIVDEAQNLDDSVLETVRMLSNFETHNAKLLQILLAGQPQLAAKLSQPRLSQLRQRVAVVGRLEPLGFDETKGYIAHRLKVAGYSGEGIFDDDAVGLICRQTRGIPRNINNLCYNSLRLAHARGTRALTAEIVQDAAARLDLESLAHPTTSLSAMMSAHAAGPAAKAQPTKPASVAPPPNSPNSAGPASSPEKAPPPSSLLTYDAPGKPGVSKWPGRSAILGIGLLCGTLFLGILVRSQSNRASAPEARNPPTNSTAVGASVNSGPAETASADYDAAPEDTGDGQVLTVAAGPQDTMKDLSIRYAGRFDGELEQKIKTLNPDLKDLNHLQEGQLVRIPLPPGAMKKVNDTGEPAAPAQPPASQGLFGKLTAMLRGRK
jgi:type II secretory pathway predicted ATPase ExeA